MFRCMRIIYFIRNDENNKIVWYILIIIIPQSYTITLDLVPNEFNLYYVFMYIFYTYIWFGCQPVTSRT